MADEEGTLNYSDWSGTEELYIEIDRSDVEHTNALFRHYNDLDVGVTVNLYGTTTDDATYDGGWIPQWNREQSLPGGGGINSGAMDYDTLSDDWEFIRVGVTPDTNPSSGDFSEVSVKRRHGGD